MKIEIAVNGRRQRLRALPNRTLADALREDLLLTGCKIGCDQGVCGACTVLVDGAPTTACMTFLFEVAGRSVTTIEGVAGADGQLSAVQSAFLRAGAFQCGFCTPGIILSVEALLANEADPDDATIRNWLGANICRCTGYSMIVEAVKLAVGQRIR